MNSNQRQFSADAQSGVTSRPCHHRKGVTIKVNPSTPTTPGATFPGALRGSSLKGWQRERAARLHRFFVHIEARIEAGKGLRQAFKQVAWWYQAKPRFYRGTARRVRFSRSTLIRLFYRWRAGGRTAEAVALRYRPGRAKLPAEEVTAFARMCLAPMVCSLAGAHQVLHRPAGSCAAFRHSLPTGFRKQVVSLFEARRSR